MAIWDRSPKAKHLREAKRAERRKEYDRAGDYYYMAGHIEQAASMYVAGGQASRAAQLFERDGDLKRAAELFVQAREYRTAADLYARSGDKRRAAQLYEKVGEWFRAAQLEEEARRWAQAAELYVKANQSDKAAQMYARAGAHRQAAQVLEDYLERADQLLRTGAATREQIARFRDSCADFYLKARQYMKAGQIWEEIGQYTKAAAAYELGKDQKRCLEMYVKARDINRAFDVYQHLEPSEVPHQLAAQIMEAKEQWLDAARLYEADGSGLRAAECFERAGDLLRAAEVFEQEGDLERAGDLFCRVGETARAANVLERAGKPLLAAQLAEENGDLERALGLYLEAEESLAAGKLQRKLGQLDQAIATLQKIESDSMDYQEAGLELARCFAEKGLHSIAAEKFESVLGTAGVSSNNIETYYDYGKLLEQTGSPQRARPVYEKILASDIGYRDVAQRLEALGQPPGTPPSIPSPVADVTPMADPVAVGAVTQVMEDVDRPGQAEDPSGRYEIVENLGRSGSHEVLKAWDTTLARTVVIKKFTPHSQDQVGQARRLIHEAQAASKLHHSNIVTIYDAGERPEGCFIYMEYVHGESLRQMLQREGRVSAARAAEIAIEILQALDHAHSMSVTHRNLRPESVQLSANQQVKVMDFGLNSRVSDLESQPITPTSPLHYVSPEQVRGERVGPAADIYSVGCILYELLTGRPPFLGDKPTHGHLELEPVPPSRYVPNLPPPVEKVVMRCLLKDPRARYGSPQHAIEDLRSAEFMPGMRLANRYEIVEEIGSGGMGKVFKMRDHELDELIAMKVLRPEFGDDTVVEQRFIREIKLARRIVHPSVVKVYDFGKWKSYKYITMEYIDGVSLDEWVNRNGSGNIPVLARFMVQVCEALEAAHRLGVVHRDIKPQNVLIAEGSRAKLVDFGIARVHSLTDLTSSRQIVGSPKYMSPEQILGRAMDHRTDIYSMGILMYYVFTGVEPFVAEDTNGIIMKHVHETAVPPTQVNPQLPPWLEMIILKAMVKDPAGRYQRAADLARAIVDSYKAATAEK